MPKATDARVVSASLYLIPIRARMPLKFGPETLTEVTCARVRLVVRDRAGRQAEGWGETPLSVQWVWPSTLPYETRLQALIAYARRLTVDWPDFGMWGHPIEIGNAFTERLHACWKQAAPDGMPWLAALVCESPFDLALHDAYANLHKVPVYQTYTSEYMNMDLGHFLEAEESAAGAFAGRYPCDFLIEPAPATLPAWHLVGGKDALETSDLTGDEPDDGYPVLLRDWIACDGLTCLKIKLTGTDAGWDYERIARVGAIAIERDCTWLSADFNCTVNEPDYVNRILDRLMRERPRIYQMLLYVEQPFPYDLEENRIDVHSVAARKPLFMDESAHDWRIVRLGRALGWSGVALKTCKTQTGAILELCWARAHGMPLMVQDLSNPMLAQISHVQLAAHAGTIMGVETNGMQFYPAASLPEAEVHPGLYTRKAGGLSLDSIRGTGFGYRLEEIRRELPKADTSVESSD